MNNIYPIVLFTVLFCLLALIIWTVFYEMHAFVHKKMTISYSTEWGYGTFDRFISEFNKKKWEHDPQYPKSYFDYGTDSEIHASIVRFDGKGMVLKGSDFRKFKKFLRINRFDNLPKDIWS